MLKYDLLASLIAPGSRVLDVGCGQGHLALALSGRAESVDGLDASLDRMLYRESYANLWRACVENDVVAYGDYDAVVFADVLEHLREPERVLRLASDALKEGGRLIVSLPNVAYWTNRLNLLCGRWRYEDEGIMDRTHLRFFTRASSRELLESSGFQIECEIPEAPILAGALKTAIYQQAMRISPENFAIGFAFQAVPVKKSG
ncbi:MAG: class I SAM-dependent methyltransferase [Candidatus Nitrohelix vancouverensis]|uniref:Class I SAM-dependent methyltransferase n=1 Tax=Candidatus Nitrohelix vancouverensis TaxID=2705534 RepID=A0A7T0BZV9_9BACT|nr:MAG: class I SAM-dependent methyltransferase [Candidatus Nitrohelix vancouverensis]